MEAGWHFKRHSYVRKHLKTIPTYVRFAWKSNIEYKFNVVTNLLQQIIGMVVWIIFWNILLSKFHEIGQWKLPALIMLTGFYYIGEAFWQIAWYTVGLSYDISRGKLDTILVKPINPVYSLVMSKLQMYAVLPLSAGFGLVLYTFIKYYSVSIMWKLGLALLMNVFAIFILHFIYIFVATLAFWFGKVMFFRTLVRMFLVSRSYPIDILSIIWRFTLTFIFPYAFISTYPVLVLTQYNARQILIAFGIELFVLVIWGLIMFKMWKAGLRRYEAFGG